MEYPRPFDIRIKNKWESGSPFRMPLDLVKVGEGDPLIKMEKKADEVKDIIHLIQGDENP
jgi:hypothetical protein